MKKISLILAAILLIVSCGDANRQYVRKAIRIMDKQGLFAEGPGWESAKAEALSAKPGSLEEAQEIVRTGGNMYPMIAAAHRFLANDDDMLRFRTRKRTQWIPLSSAVQMAGVQQQSRIECPVAILTDSLTASSGEATLICFRGLDHVRVFGGPTAGYASANQPFELPGGDRLVLTIGCDVARTGEVFCDDPIEPDVRTDTPLEDALAWINEQ